MGRVIFGMISNDSRPVGGIKVIFQAVGGLRRAGVKACILSTIGWKIIPWRLTLKF